MEDDSETASNKIIEMVTELVDYYIEVHGLPAVNGNDLHELIEWHFEQRRSRHAEVDKYRKT